MRILCVEDDHDIAYMIGYILERAGFEIATAEDGNGAIEQFRNDPPDACILDILLPKVDGFEVLGQIRSRPEWAGVPVIMLTARGLERDIVRAFDLGADDYIVKPFQPHELVARVKRLLSA